MVNQATVRNVLVLIDLALKIVANGLHGLRPFMYIVYEAYLLDPIFHFPELRRIYHSEMVHCFSSSDLPAIKLSSTRTDCECTLTKINHQFEEEETGFDLSVLES